MCSRSESSNVITGAAGAGADGRFSIIRMNELQVWRRQQFLLGISQCASPSGIDLLKIPVKAGNAQRIDDEFEQALYVVFRRHRRIQRGLKLIRGLKPTCSY
jgi:hypothetical protein